MCAWPSPKRFCELCEGCKESDLKQPRSLICINYIVVTSIFPDIVIWQSTEKRLRREKLFCCAEKYPKSYHLGTEISDFSVRISDFPIDFTGLVELDFEGPDRKFIIKSSQIEKISSTANCMF